MEIQVIAERIRSKDYWDMDSGDKATETDTKINIMCINCKKYKCGECYTTEKVWTGCVRREVKR